MTQSHVPSESILHDSTFIPHYHAGMLKMWRKLMTRTGVITLRINNNLVIQHSNIDFYDLVRKYDVEDEPYVFDDAPLEFPHYTASANRLWRQLTTAYPFLDGHETYFFKLMKAHHASIPWAETERMDAQYKDKLDFDASARAAL
jgi:hypothetical protein